MKMKPYSYRVAATAGLAALLLAIGVRPAMAGSGADTVHARATLLSRFSAEQKEDFARLTAVDQKEMVAIFADPNVQLGVVSGAQLTAEYPGADSFDSSGTTRVNRTGTSLQANGTLTPAATYSVHSWFHHTVSFLFLSNTASLDYYYYTNGRVVTSDQRCTWSDTGISTSDIDNVSVDHHVTSGYGVCEALVQISASFWLSGPASGHGTVDQEMEVDGHSSAPIWTYFHQVAP